MRRGPRPKLTPEQVAEIFERLTCSEVPLKVICIEYDISRSQLYRTLENAKQHGLALWRRNWETDQ